MKFVRVTAKLAYEEASLRRGEFEREFESFSLVDSDPVEDYIQKMKAKEGKNAPDEMTIRLLSELHKKIDTLTKIVRGEERPLLSLERNIELEYAWFDAIKVSGLNPGALYYARLRLSLFRPRDIPFFFEAIDEESAKIVTMWPSDKADYDGYLASKEREEIARERAI